MLDSLQSAFARMWLIWREQNLVWMSLLINNQDYYTLQMIVQHSIVNFKRYKKKKQNCSFLVRSLCKWWIGDNYLNYK